MTNTLNSIQQAVDLFSLSKLNEAVDILTRIVNENKKVYDAFNFLGIIKLHQKDYNSALKYFLKVTEINPSHLIAMYNLGLTYQNLNNPDKAIINYSKVLKRQPDYMDALNNLGLIYKDKKEYKLAENYFIKVINLYPNNAKAWNNLANLSLEKEKYDEAVGAYKKAIEIEPSNPDYYYNLATAYLKINHFEESIQNLKKTLELAPDHLQAINNLGIAYNRSGDFDKAMDIYRNMSDKKISFSEILINKANSLKQSNELENAIRIYEEILNSEPENKTALFNLSEIYHQLGREREADELISRITSVRENKVALFSNLALAKMKQKNFDGAVTLCKRALSIDSNTVVKYNLAHIQLLMGNFEEGWQNYEARTGREDFVKRKFSKPELVNQKIAGKTIYVYDEQGLGDSIQFVRYLKLLKEKGCRIIFECDHRLIYLFCNLKCCDEIIPRKNFDEPAVNYDYHISLLSLPLYFNTKKDSIPHDLPYLEANKELVSELSAVINKKNIFNVGIVWAGNPKHTNDTNRSCSLENFERLLNITGTRFFSLQKGEAVKQISEKNLLVVDLDSKGLSTYAHTAAIIENLDLIISVDTSVAHLAGAMGKKVWVLLPYIPDWRWLLDRNDSPWYPTMKLFRQLKPESWKEVFDKVIGELQNEITNSNNGLVIQNSHAENSLNNLIQDKTKSSNDTLYLGLSSGENYGWGVCSKYLIKELPKFINIKNADELNPSEKINGIFFNALIDINFNPLYPNRGEVNLGYTFFEKVLTKKSLENSRYYDLIFAGSSWCKNKMTEAGIFNSDILIQGIDPELFYEAESKTNDNLFVIFSGGKLELRKGHDLVLKAVKILQEKYKDIILINAWYNYFPASLATMNFSKHVKYELIQGTWQEQMDHVYRINGLEPTRIVTLPIVPHNKLMEIYLKTDIGLFPNRCEGGTNLVLMEYMACGKPVIASYTSGHTDILSEENSFPLTDLKEFNFNNKEQKIIAQWEEADVDEIVEKIEYAYHNREIIKCVGKKGAKDMKNFTWNETSKYLYEKIIRF